MKTITFADFYDDEAVLANKLVDYYEGNQLAYLINMMNGKDSNGGKRHNWKSRGMSPRVRNVVKSIIDKRVPLFTHPPVLEVWQEDSDEPVIPPVLQDILYKADWLEFFNNVDHFTSLLKSVAVFSQKYIAEESVTVNGIYQYNKQNDALMLSLLHRGNSVIRQDRTQTLVTEVAWITVPRTDLTSDWQYHVLTTEGEYQVDVNGMESLENRETVTRIGDNVDGIIPVTPFYDTGKPRNGFWNKVPEDLVSVQDLFNLALTDTEFAIAHQKQKTLFTTGVIVDSSSNQTTASIPTAPIGHTPSGALWDDLPGMQPVATVGGLGQIVTVNPDVNGNAPTIKYDGPESDLDRLWEVTSSIVAAIAQDYSVKVNIQTSSIVANSGYQLIVEELPNLTLRTKRISTFQAAACRWYQILQVLYPELTEGELLMVFAPPSLPVNAMEEDTLWEQKIAGNRASLLDYFKEVKGLTDEQARDKIDEVLTINAMVAQRMMLDTTPDPDDVTPTNPDPESDDEGSGASDEGSGEPEPNAGDATTNV